MLRSLALLAGALLLSACQNVVLDRDYDTSRDFASYRSWSWQTPALTYQPDDARLKSDLTEQRIRESVDEALLQRGLRPAADGAAGDLKVRAALIVDERKEELTTGYAGGWGGYWGNYWGGPMLAQTRTVEYKVGTIQIDLYDAHDGKLVWRGSAEQIIRRDPPSPAERAQAIRDTVNQVLSQYPPR